MTALPPIALTGRLRSGKNAVADYLTETYGYTQFAFGDELKRHYHAIFGASETKPREGYQWFGQTMRQRDPDVWVRKCFEAIEREDGAFFRGGYSLINTKTDETLISVPANPLRPVITDIRQPNEFERCRSEGFVIIRITAPESLRIDRAIKSADNFALSDLTHDTESHVDKFAADYEIVNDGTLADLYAKVDAIIAEVAANG